MSDTTTTIYKLFWADQDEEQEQWLRERARQGLHLKKVSMFCGYTFVKGEPADIVYRIDFTTTGRSSDYNRLLEDAGWEQATEVTGWQYWRKAVVDGQAPEIFTDNASKIARMQQVLWILTLTIMPMLLTIVITNKRNDADDVTKAILYFMIGLAVVTIPLYGYGAMRLLKRIRVLRNGA